MRWSGARGGRVGALHEQHRRRAAPGSSPQRMAPTRFMLTVRRRVPADPDAHGAGVDSGAAPARLAMIPPPADRTGRPAPTGRGWRGTTSRRCGCAPGPSRCAAAPGRRWRSASASSLMSSAVDAADVGRPLDGPLGRRGEELVHPGGVLAREVPRRPRPAGAGAGPARSASTTSVPGRTARCRSARWATPGPAGIDHDHERGAVAGSASVIERQQVGVGHRRVGAPDDDEIGRGARPADRPRACRRTCRPTPGRPWPRRWCGPPREPRAARTAAAVSAAEVEGPGRRVVDVRQRRRPGRAAAMASRIRPATRSSASSHDGGPERAAPLAARSARAASSPARARTRGGRGA